MNGLLSQTAFSYIYSSYKNKTVKNLNIQA